MSDGRTGATGRRLARFAAGGGLLVAVVARAGLAAAADPQAPPDPKTVSEVVVTAAKTVSELVVTAKIKCLTVDRISPGRHGPNVVSSYPANGQTVRPGLVLVRVTFDAPVACSGGLTDDPPLPNPCPETVQLLVLSFDRRSVRIVCRLDPDTRYGAWLSHAPQNSFFSLTGEPASPFKLEFASSTQAPITRVCEAMAEDPDTARLLEARGKLDCAGPLDDADARVEAEVRRLDQSARLAEETARATALAWAEAQRRAIETRDLAQAEGLARKAYATAFRLKRNEYERAASGRRREITDEDDRLAEAPDLTRLSRRATHIDGRAVAASIDPAAKAAGAPPTPDVALAAWSAKFTVDGREFVCGQPAGVVSCERTSKPPP